MEDARQFHQVEPVQMREVAQHPRNPSACASRKLASTASRINSMSGASVDAGEPPSGEVSPGFEMSTHGCSASPDVLLLLASKSNYQRQGVKPAPAGVNALVRSQSGTSLSPFREEVRFQSAPNDFLGLSSPWPPSDEGVAMAIGAYFSRSCVIATISLPDIAGREKIRAREAERQRRLQRGILRRNFTANWRAAWANPPMFGLFCYQKTTFYGNLAQITL